MLDIETAVAVLEPHRQSYPTTMADIEVALRRAEAKPPPTSLIEIEDDAKWLAEAQCLSPNLHKLVVNNRRGNETASFREEFQELGLKPHQVQRLLDELNKLPSDSPFVLLSIIASQVIQWARAEDAIGAPPQPRGLIELLQA